VSQTRRWAAEGALLARFHAFVRDGKSEAIREHLVLLAHGPRPREPEALAPPQHGFEALDRAPGRVEGAKAADGSDGPAALRSGASRG
jgi:hypothetical protein